MYVGGSQNSGYLLGVLIISAMVFWGSILGSLILGNYHVGFAICRRFFLELGTVAPHGDRACIANEILYPYPPSTPWNMPFF